MEQSNILKSAQTNQWKQEFAAGGVVYKRDNDAVFVLLVNPRGPNYGSATDKWTFPKGLYDQDGESQEQTALREVREEGGVNAAIVESLGSVKFFRKSKAYGNAIKMVDFWLMEYVDGNVEDHDQEIAEVKWFQIDEVGKMLAWPHDQEIFVRAQKFIS